jgi:hypothetical protein
VSFSPAEEKQEFPECREYSGLIHGIFQQREREEQKAMALTWGEVKRRAIEMNLPDDIQVADYDGVPFSDMGHNPAENGLPEQLFFECADDAGDDEGE